MAYRVFHEERHSSALCFKMWIVCSAVSGSESLNVTKQFSDLLKSILMN